MKNTLNLDCSVQTVRRALDDVGLFARIPRVTPPLTDVHIRKRTSFATGYAHFDLSTVLFSDEMSIRLGPQGQHWVRRPIGEEWNPKYVLHKRKHPPKVHVWACFSAHGVGDIYLFTENLDAPLMKHILQKHLLSSAHRMWPRGQWWFQQDNDPKHSSRLVQQWIKSHGIDCVEWPPYSPDLNPIENLWADLKKRVDKHNPTSIYELITVLQLEWDATTTEACAKLAASMPERLAAVRSNGGVMTGY